MLYASDPAGSRIAPDLGSAVIKVGKIHWGDFVGGWGTVVSEVLGAAA